MQQQSTFGNIMFHFFGWPGAIYRLFAGTGRYPLITYLVWLQVFTTIGATVNSIHQGHGYALGEWAGTFLVAAVAGSLLTHVRQDSWWRWLTWCPMFFKTDRFYTWADGAGNVSNNDVLRGSTVEDTTKNRPASTHSANPSTIHIGGVAIDPTT